MIPIHFYNKNDELQENLIRERFCDINLQNRQPGKINKLNTWCAAHFPQKRNGDPYTIQDVIVASPEKLMELKNYLDFNGDLETINQELYSVRRGHVRGSYYIIGTLYENMEDEAKRFLIGSLDITVCPYCNRNYIFSSKNVNTCQLDHFFSKEKYPIFAASFYNLIPVCGTCNHLKNNHQFMYYPHLQDTDDILRFSYKIKGSDFLKNKESLEVTLNNIPDEYIEQINRLKLLEIYHGHRDVLVDIIKKRTIFPEIYLNALAEKFPSLISIQSAKELIYGVPLSKESQGNRPLSKFTQDILDEINKTQ